MSDAPRQPWQRSTKADPVSEEAMTALFNQMETRAMEREQRFKVFLALVPLLWGGISFVFWFIYFTFIR